MPGASRSTGREPRAVPRPCDRRAAGVRARRSRADDGGGRDAHHDSSRLVAGAGVLTRLVTQPRLGWAGQGSFSADRKDSVTVDVGRCRERNDKSDGVDLALFGAGWILGWLLLFRLRAIAPGAAAPQHRSTTTPRSPHSPASVPSIAVVVPARNEAAALAHLLVRAGRHNSAPATNSWWSTTTRRTQPEPRLATQRSAGARTRLSSPRAGWASRTPAGTAPDRPPRRSWCSSTPTSDRLRISSTARPSPGRAIPMPSRRCSRGTAPDRGSSRRACWPT
jgi:hypothetical protein